MRRFLFLIPLAACLWAFAEPLGAFCGFYVARADTTIFNQASQVILVRDGDRTVLTMANDFKGDPKEFAVVIPVPTFITRDQIHVAEKSLVDHVDAYTAPRLVEYFDEDPCRVYKMSENMAMPSAAGLAVDAVKERAKALGVTIEAQYTVGEYDIVILSAAQSSGLETWLTSNGYRMPAGAGPVLGSYIRQNMRFFVAKVNVKEQSRLGYAFLRPLQVAYESPKFMLPIRLGTVNSSGTQELFIYALTRSGRVETTNYRTVKLPSGMDAAGVDEGTVCAVLPRDVRSHGPPRGHAGGLPRVRLGHGLVRSLLGGSAVGRRVADARGVLARSGICTLQPPAERWSGLRETRRAARRLRHAVASPLRRRALP